MAEADQQTQQIEGAEGAPQTPQESQQQAPDLDALLSEFEQQSQFKPGNEPPPPPPPPVSEDELSSIRRELQEIKSERIRESSRHSVEEAVAEIKRVGELEASDLQIEGYLHAMAARDPRLAEAFANQHQDPRGFRKVLEGVAEKIKADARAPDARASADAQAVRAAVRTQGQQTSEPDKPDPAKLFAMSDAEFEAHKAGLDSQ
jgi:hypothetical protein